ncbi:MAG TPA: alpha/beta hydrolase family protein [Verrucomicrobiae bacterium]
MIAPLAKLQDWLVIQAVTMLTPAKDQNPRLEEALQFLDSPDFIPVESMPAQVELNGGRDFHFPTPRPCGFTENNVAHGRLYRCGERWQERPVIIFLHGAGGVPDYHIRFPIMARRCNRAGLNAATLVAPYQLRRRPREFGGTLGYLDCLQFAEATAQAISEIRALAGWLLGKGCPAVALWGYSQGAWYAGMTVCHDARLGSAVLAAPCARLNPWVEQRAVRPPIRTNLPMVSKICAALNQTAMNLTLTRPVIPKENILIIEGIHELICPKEEVDELCQAWGQTDIWRLPQGHFGICCGFVPGLPGRVIRWLSPRLKT